MLLCTLQTNSEISPNSCSVCNTSGEKRIVRPEKVPCSELHRLEHRCKFWRRRTKSTLGGCASGNVTESQCAARVTRVLFPATRDASMCSSWDGWMVVSFCMVSTPTAGEWGRPTDFRQSSAGLSTSECGFWDGQRTLSHGPSATQAILGGGTCEAFKDSWHAVNVYFCGVILVHIQRRRISPHFV